MSNLPHHLPAEYELFRHASRGAKHQSEANETTSGQSRGTCRDGGLWWSDQRFLNQVAPAEMVNPDNFDNVKYKYQLYARPPPVHCEPCQSNDWSHVTEEAAPVRYNVRRVAMDKKLPCQLPCPERCRYRLNCPYGTSNNNSNNICNNNIDYNNNNINNIDYNNVSNNNIIKRHQPPEADLKEDDNNNNNNNNNGGHDGDLDLALKAPKSQCHSAASVEGSKDLSLSKRSEEKGGVSTAVAQLVGGACGVSESSDWNENNNNSEDRWSCQATCGSQSEVSAPRSTHTPGYGTYKLIGGHQYHIPQVNLYDDLQLPPAQAEYREFQRRAPLFSRGRYDRAHPDNELMLVADKSATLIESTLTPFCTLRNPKRKTTRLFAPDPVEELVWPEPSKECF